MIDPCEMVHGKHVDARASAIDEAERQPVLTLS